jgi:hypothetical protein
MIFSFLSTNFARALCYLDGKGGEPMPPEYTTLFNAITDAIRILQEAQIKAEELVIEQGED